jgi:uncharacterized protein YkwD
MARLWCRPGRILAVALLPLLVYGVAATAAPAAHADSSARGDVADLIARTNTIRQEAGCDPVEVDARLRSVAQQHASDMARRGYLEHEDSDGESSDERIASTGYTSVTGENLAHGYASAAEVVDVWMRSAEHRRNIEDCAFTHVGVGYVPNGHYWVQDFGG